MNEKRIKEIKDRLKAMFQEVLESGEEPPQEIQDLMWQALEKAQQQVKQLREEEEQPGITIHPDIQMLWTLSGGQQQAFLSYLREYPSQATQALLLDPNRLSSVITQLERSNPKQAKPEVNGIQPIDLQSSNIFGTKYNKKTGKMLVQFQGGSIYEYDGVPQNIYRAFVKGNASAKTSGKNQYGQWFVGKNPSAGAAMNQYIKAANFPYRKLS